MIHIRALQPEDNFHDLIALSEDFFRIEQLDDSNMIDYFSHWLKDENGKAFILHTTIPGRSDVSSGKSQI